MENMSTIRYNYIYSQLNIFFYQKFMLHEPAFYSTDS